MVGDELESGAREVRARGWVGPLSVGVVVASWALTLAANTLQPQYIESLADSLAGLARAAADQSTTGDQGSVARPPRPHAATGDEAAAHAAFVDLLTDPIWRQ